MSKVLIVDDNHDILEALHAVLTAKKMQVRILTEPRRLTEFIDEYKPDVLLMDIALGGYDGRELCRKIKDDEKRGKLPVILFTAQNYEPESIAACQADAFLEKPFPLQHLYDTIQKVLA